MVNRGPRDTEEVIQLYLRDEDSPFAPPNPILCGFKRFFLAAGVQKTLSVPLDEKAFTVVTDTGDRIPGSGRWTLYAGFGGPDKRTEALTGRKARAVPIRTPQ
ncbi:MAG: fibronectin type III-like domain-contianing protein, partial [Clostridia bacterium]|nr:fibronectin type III-like domain-contianing protein [Clostridia bacterium]